MEDEMRLSRNISAKGALACGFLLMALALAAPSSAAEVKNHAPVSRYLALHHSSSIRAPPHWPRRGRLSSYSTAQDPMFPLHGNPRPMA
jgi:hypothetical protein